MLMEFRVENFRSLCEEQALSLLAAGRFEPGDQTPRQSITSNSSVLPAVAIYGANASGKSNVLAALAFMRDAVLLSHRLWNPEGGIPRTPFAWNDRSKSPSLFEATFEATGIEFNYGFTVSDSEVEEEWLHANPLGRKEVWFERTKSKYHFGLKFRGPLRDIKALTRPNALFLSTAVQVGHESLKGVFRFFSMMNPFGKLAGSRMLPSPSMIRSMGLPWMPPSLFPSLGLEQSSLFKNEDDVVTQVRDLFRAADFGIVDIRKKVSERQSSDGRTIKQEQYFFQHEEGNEEAWLPLDEESDGTQVLFRIAPLLVRLLGAGGVLLVDELESSLHPRLAAKIVEMFNCPKTNPANAQLIFSTHDTNLLGNIAGTPSLRRDQIWFTEKDKLGATKLYPLTNYKPRNPENLERGYLQGRYGAVPFLGSFRFSETADKGVASQP